ncbi:MAG: hypothetical protein PHR35_12635 [Kiritimatiellae bacterium]|nr:hypothetical protein [Kiritimatiellia bacterium]
MNIKKCVAVVAAVAALCVAAVAVAGEFRVVSVTTAASGEWTNPGGVWLLKSIMSGATGGVLTAYQDYATGSASVPVRRQLGDATTILDTNRVVAGFPTDAYILPAQKIALTNSGVVASHPVYLLIERQD